MFQRDCSPPSQSVCHRPTHGFLPCDSMHKRRICYRKTSVHLPFRRWCYIEMAKYIIKLCSPSGSHANLVFPYQTALRYSNGTPPLTGASNTGGVKNRYFRPISRFTSEMIQYIAIVTMVRQYRNSYTTIEWWPWVTWRNIRWHEASHGMASLRQLVIAIPGSRIPGFQDPGRFFLIESLA